jgi:hypothetical protein
MIFVNPKSKHITDKLQYRSNASVMFILKIVVEFWSLHFLGMTRMTHPFVITLGRIDLIQWTVGVRMIEEHIDHHTISWA